MKLSSSKAQASPNNPNDGTDGTFTVTDLAEYKRLATRYATAVITLATVTILGGVMVSLSVGPPRGVVWLSGGVVGFFVGLAVMDWFAPRQVWKCPWCRESLANRMNWVEKSRACPHCERRVIDAGRLRKASIMKRYYLRQQSAMTAKWLWGPVVFGWFFLLMQPVWPPWFAGPDHIILLFPAMSVAALWVYVRSGDSRARLPAVMSLLLVLTSLVVYLVEPLS